MFLLLLTTYFYLTCSIHATWGRPFSRALGVQTGGGGVRRHHLFPFLPSSRSSSAPPSPAALLGRALPSRSLSRSVSTFTLRRRRRRRNQKVVWGSSLAPPPVGRLSLFSALSHPVRVCVCSVCVGRDSQDKTRAEEPRPLSHLRSRRDLAADSNTGWQMNKPLGACF